jgi:hypothetical protein
MSSPAVRTIVKNFLAAESTEDVVDLTAEFEELRKLLADSNVMPDAPWLGLEFVGDDELPVSLAATNDKGLYRETGSIILHVCATARIGVGQTMLARAEVLRNLFRGRRIEGTVLIESVTPMNTGRGATLEFDGGYVSGTVTVSYHYDSTP